MDILEETCTEHTPGTSGFDHISAILPSVLTGICQQAAAQPDKPSTTVDRGYRRAA